MDKVEEYENKFGDMDQDMWVCKLYYW